MTGTAAYVNVDDLKEHVTIEDAGDDSRLTVAAMEASRLIDKWCGRPGFDKDAAATPRYYFAPRSYDLDVVRTIRVDDFWDAASLVIKTDDNDDGVYESTWLTSDYQLEPSGGLRGGVIGWPYSEIITTFVKGWPIDYPIGGQWTSRRYVRAISITAKWGWIAVPDAVHRATLTLAERLYAERKAPFGIDPMGIYIGRDRMSQVADMLDVFRNHSNISGFGGNTTGFQ